MALIALAGGALFGERIGSNPPRVLALHGWGRRGADFATALAGLDVLALDLPGFGASPPPERAVGAHGYAELISAAYEVFDHPPVVVGHSFGGRVAVARQADHPGAAAGMVLVAVPLLHRSSPPVRPSPAFRLARWAHRAGFLGDERMERLRRSRGSADYRAATGVMRDVLVTTVNETYEEELRCLDVPVHLLWGDGDIEVPVEVAARAAAIIADGDAPVDFDVLPGVGHHVPLAAPQSLRAAVEAMLEKVG